MRAAQVVGRWTVAGMVLLGVGCNQGAPEEQPTDAVGTTRMEVVGGSPTTVGENPWQVSLQSASGDHFCGGSIIDASWVLTAQHCVNEGGAVEAPERVVAGISTLSGTHGSAQVRTVSEVIVYPGYTDTNSGHDVALLHLSEPLDLGGADVQAIGLVTPEDAAAGITAPGVVARVTGWGALQSDGASPDVLQTADVDLLDGSEAQRDYAEETLTPDQLAAAAPGRDACQGDSGGPLTVQKGDTRLLAGVVSWGYGCADTRYPGLYARVSSFEPWIAAQLSGTAPQPATLFEQTDLAGEAGAWTSFTVSVPEGTTSLTVTQSGGTGDADLYVRHDGEPTDTAFDCRPAKEGNGETCVLPSPAAGTWTVSVRGYAAYAGVTLKATAV